MYLIFRITTDQFYVILQRNCIVLKKHMLHLVKTFFLFYYTINPPHNAVKLRNLISCDL